MAVEWGCGCLCGSSCSQIVPVIMVKDAHTEGSVRLVVADDYIAVQIKLFETRLEVEKHSVEDRRLLFCDFDFVKY